MSIAYDQERIAREQADIARDQTEIIAAQYKEAYIADATEVPRRLAVWQPNADRAVYRARNSDNLPVTLEVITSFDNFGEGAYGLDSVTRPVGPCEEWEISFTETSSFPNYDSPLFAFKIHSTSLTESTDGELVVSHGMQDWYTNLSHGWDWQSGAGLTDLSESYAVAEKPKFRKTGQAGNC
ncbi:hypothetical protein HCN51_54875 [Nonomuraea sp. FMUSA5-5]|uniref:Uncharacterized protein n=1 Tax=Nonomuraea composti TaxID=2720023 RepID=A0ABX1BRK0_9ACTN|nr:hypothetical protein [Nonomuraea sp. FMUSA5-5]NJP98416.1 hypothetical protein [Nonomuraea sp. FMUSA5-5]